MVNQMGALDRVFQALADPSRRIIVERLARGPASVSELAQPLTMSLPAVLQHLQVLETCGLVRSEKTGRVRTCRIEPQALSLAGHPGSPAALWWALGRAFHAGAVNPLMRGKPSRHVAGDRQRASACFGGRRSI